VVWELTAVTQGFLHASHPIQCLSLPVVISEYHSISVFQTIMSIPVVSSKDPANTANKSTAGPVQAFGCPSPYAEPLWYSRNATPYYNDSHRQLRAAVRKYVDEELLPNAFEWESAGRVPDTAREFPHNSHK
jgi:hypothetical protein